MSLSAGSVEESSLGNCKYSISPPLFNNRQVHGWCLSPHRTTQAQNLAVQPRRVAGQILPVRPVKKSLTRWCHQLAERSQGP